MIFAESATNRHSALFVGQTLQVARGSAAVIRGDGGTGRGVGRGRD